MRLKQRAMHRRQYVHMLQSVTGCRGSIEDVDSQASSITRLLKDFKTSKRKWNHLSGVEEEVGNFTYLRIFEWNVHLNN